MSDNFVTANQALRGQEKKPHLGVRVSDKDKSGKLDCMEEGICTKCQQFEAKNAIFCPTCYALMHTGIERAEKLSKLGMTEAEAKKEVSWVGP